MLVPLDFLLHAPHAHALRRPLAMPLFHSEDSCNQTLPDISVWSIVFPTGILYVLWERFSFGTVRTSDKSFRATGKVYLPHATHWTSVPWSFETSNSQFWIILIAGLVYHLLELREKIPSTCGLSYALSLKIDRPTVRNTNNKLSWFVMSEVLIFLAVQKTPQNGFLSKF